jgi:hypothetical protein
VHLWSRNGRDWSVEFAAITAAILAMPVTRMVLDGEAVAHCPEGLPDFNALLGRHGCPTVCLYARSTSCTSAPTICGPWSFVSVVRCSARSCRLPPLKRHTQARGSSAPGQCPFCKARICC